MPKSRSKPAAKAAAAPAIGSKPTPATKLQTILALLRRPGGATITDLMQATGWQAHSVRGALSAQVRGKLKLTLQSEKTAEGRVYRIDEAAA